MKLTLNKAAQTCGRAKSTLIDAIKSGRLSAPKDDRGRYAIDPAELHRVFPFDMIDHREPVPNRSSEPLPTTPESHPNTQALEREIELLREMLGKAEANAEHWREMAKRQQVLLEDKRATGGPIGLWRRVFGR